jgi:hypothetical protein
MASGECIADLLNVGLTLQWGGVCADFQFLVSPLEGNHGINSNGCALDPHERGGVADPA